MKTLFLVSVLFGLLCPAARAQAPALKLTPKDIRVLPFCREFKEQKFKTNDRELSDELRVTTGERIHFYGKKRGEVVRVTGRQVGHVGKLVLMPPDARTGTLTVKVPTVEEVTHYFAVLEMADESLSTKTVKLLKGKNYLWALKVENGQTALRIVADGKEVESLTGATDQVKGFGFAATVRAKGNEADATITFD